MIEAPKILLVNDFFEDDWIVCISPSPALTRNLATVVVCLHRQLTKFKTLGHKDDITGKIETADFIWGFWCA